MNLYWNSVFLCDFIVIRLTGKYILPIFASEIDFKTQKGYMPKALIIQENLGPRVLRGGFFCVRDLQKEIPILKQSMGIDRNGNESLSDLCTERAGIARCPTLNCVY